MEGDLGDLVAPTDEERSHLRKLIGQRCREARLELGYSGRRLAREMQRSDGWVREIERGDQYAPPYLIKTLAQATGHSVSWFYGDDRLEQSIRDVAGEVARRLTQMYDTRNSTDDSSARRREKEKEKEQ